MNKESNPSTANARLSSYLVELAAEAARLHSSKCPLGWGWIWYGRKRTLHRRSVIPIEHRKELLSQPPSRPEDIPGSAVPVLEYVDPGTPSGSAKTALWPDYMFIADEQAGFPCQPEGSHLDGIRRRLVKYRKEAAFRFRSDPDPKARVAAKILRQAVRDLEETLDDGFGHGFSRPTPEEVLALAVSQALRVGDRLRLLRVLPNAAQRKQNEARLAVEAGRSKSPRRFGKRGHWSEAWMNQLSTMARKLKRPQNAIEATEVLADLKRSGQVCEVEGGLFDLIDIESGLPEGKAKKGGYLTNTVHSRAMKSLARLEDSHDAKKAHGEENSSAL